eukprot:556745-Amphidinium_carterae.1
MVTNPNSHFTIRRFLLRTILPRARQTLFARNANLNISEQLVERLVSKCYKSSASYEADMGKHTANRDVSEAM